MSNAIDTIDRSVRNWHRAGVLVASLAAIVLMLLFTRTAAAAVYVLEDDGPPGTATTTGTSRPADNQGNGSFALQAVDPCVNEATVARISIPGSLVVVNMASNGYMTTVDTLPFMIESTSANLSENAYCLDIEKRYVDGRTHCLDPNVITDWRLTYVLTYYPPEVNHAEMQAARQAAVWHYSNGYDLVRPDATTGDADQDQRVLAHYDAILAEVDALTSPPPVFMEGEVTLAVAPKSATNTLPGEAVHPFTVTLTKGGLPLPGYTVSVATSFGALNTATQVTDANGQASFTVTSNVAGTAQITATATVTLPTSARFIEQQLPDELQPVGYGKPVPVTVTDTASKTWVAPEPAELGDYVWLDTNVNGIQDETGTGVQGVTVNLYGNGACTGQAMATQQTDANGFYLFTGLQPGAYCVEFVKPAGYNFSPQNQGADDTKDSDANTSTGRTTAITLVAGQSDRTWDAGLYQPEPEPAELGDYVWLDTNVNGIQDETGTGVQGVTVNLYGNGACTGQAMATQQTDANGFYLFTGLQPGAYCVEFVKPAGYNFSPQNQGADDTKDSDANTSTGRTTAITLVAGQSDRTWDAGLYQPAPEPAELGDYVWYDTNVNGIQDETGTGVQGVTVNLYGNGACTGQAMATQQTDANGFYLFTGLQPGAYCVEFVKPAGYNFSPQNQGADDAKDSDANTSTGRTTAITLVAGQSDRTWDAGLYQPEPEPAELGDYVWEDTNGNGIQDETGTGVPGVTVRLYADCTGQAIDSQQTDANGFYLFTGLQPGTYCVEFEKPAGYEITGQNQGSDDTKDSDADVVTGRTQPTTLTPGESDLTWDAGLYRPAALGDRVWVDLDFESQDVLSGDGMQNKDGQGNYMEKGVPTVTVELYANGDCTGDPLAVQQTDANGNYLFTGLKPGQYCVVFRLPQGVLGIWTTPNVGPGDTDSDAITPDDALDTARKTVSISLESGETDLTWDAGLIRLSGLGSSAVGDRVWLDNNKNGIQDDGEPDFTLPLTVQLLTPGDDTPLQTITTQGGFYLFDGLDSGIYCVQFQIPTGYVVTNPNQGGSGNVDSDVDPTGRTICFQLPDLTTDLTWDMGLYTTPTDLPVSEEPGATDVRIFLPTVIRQ